MSYYRPPSTYRQDQERRARAAQETAERQARAGHKAITEFLEANEEMSEEALEFLLGLAEKFKDVTVVLGIGR